MKAEEPTENYKTGWISISLLSNVGRFLRQKMKNRLKI